MNLVELDRALRQLRLGGMAAVLEGRLLQAQTEHMAPIDLMSVLVSDELRRRADSLLERRTKHASFASRTRTRQLRLRFQQEDESPASSTSSPPATSSRSTRTRSFSARHGTGKSHLAQAIGRCAIQQGHRVLYREAHALIEDIRRRGDRRHPKGTAVRPRHRPLLIIDDLGMRKLRRQRPRISWSWSCDATSAPAPSSLPIARWRTGARCSRRCCVAAMLDRLLHHGHVLKCGPRSWRTKIGSETLPRGRYELNDTCPGPNAGRF